MTTILSLLAHATPVALALAIVAALFAALRPARVEAVPAVTAPAPKLAPAETPAVAHGGHAKGQNLDLFGGWPEGHVPPMPAEVKAQIGRVLKFRVSEELHEQLVAEAQACRQPLGTYLRALLQEQIGVGEPAADLVEALPADTLA